MFAIEIDARNALECVRPSQQIRLEDKIIRLFGKKTAIEEIQAELPELHPRLWRYCLTLTGARDRADDLCQAACLRGLEKADQFQAGTKADRWLFRIAQRIWIDEMRSQAVRTGGGLVTVDEIELPDNKSTPESNILFRQTLSEVMALPEAQRIGVLLVYVEGYSYKEAAEILDIPIGTVMSRLSAARATLGKKLGEKESKAG